MSQDLPHSTVRGIEIQMRSESNQDYGIQWNWLMLLQFQATYLQTTFYRISVVSSDVTGLGKSLMVTVDNQKHRVNLLDTVKRTQLLLHCPFHLLHLLDLHSGIRAE